MAVTLVDIAINLVNDASGQCSLQDEKRLREIFQSYIDKKISPNDLITKTMSICKSSSPAERIILIMQTENQKIPEPPKIHEKLNQARRQTRSWNSNEDNRLMMAVHKFGLENWSQIASYVGNGRTRSQCSQRWIRVLDPKISKTKWTQEEEKKLLKLVAKYGEKNWMRVSNSLGNRSDVQCRYRYNQLKRKHHNLSIPKSDDEMTTDSTPVQTSFVDQTNNSIFQSNNINNVLPYQNIFQTYNDSNINKSSDLKNISINNTNTQFENQKAIIGTNNIHNSNLNKPDSIAIAEKSADFQFDFSDALPFDDEFDIMKEKNFF